MSAILIDGSIVHYEALGRGRPIVFLNGWVGSWRYWVSAMQVASTSFRAYAIDLFGYGDTAHETIRYSLDKQASLINRFMEEMGIGKIAIVGHGLGALVGFSFIQQWPKSVDRMMAINAPLDFVSVSARLKTAPMTELIEWLSSKSPEAISALADASKADLAAVAASMGSLQADNLFTHIRTAGIPCLLVHGQNDPAIVTPTQESIDGMPSHLHQITLDSIGHFPMIDNPSQFNRLMTDFLALETGLSPKELQLKEEWKRRVR